MATIGTVRAVFTASAGGLVAGTNAAGMGLRRLGRDSEQASRGLALANSRLGSLMAINGAQLFASMAGAATSAVRSLLAFGSAEAETIDKTSKMAARLGLTYGELAGLGHAGDLAGVSLETIGKAATKADVAFVKASQGSAQALSGFEAIGLSLDDLQGLSASERFAAITDALAGMPTEAERAAAAVKLFGRAGAEMLPLFAAGAGSIRDATAEAERFGMALSGAQGRDVEEMNDSFSKVRAAVGGVVQQVVAYLAPAITNVSDTFTSLVGSVGGANIGQTIGEGILTAARYFASVVDVFVGGSGGVMEAFAAVGEYWFGVWDSGSRVSAVFAAIGRGLAGVFQSMVLGVTGTIGALLKGAQAIAGAFGLQSNLLDTASAAADAFNNKLGEGATANFAAAGQNFDIATGGGRSMGAASAGPMARAMDEAIARSRAAKDSVDVAKRTAVGGGGLEGGRGSEQKLSAVESRSKEGIAEMFRLMRGQADDVQERQLGCLEQLVENTDDMGLDVMELDFAG
ncbi:hypothetical protein UFOVP1124_12 [uncultured Caudovirales phage]|uniref:Bacteriophage lambda, GpH, tail tape measure, C-terminal n=1 Tax=uncultured Caudovirales phage TaxID=2100421 RepID=A0A6J5QPL2_9CAUD|nr:hypothetical protein UFOVP1124_12 [uncultured Caudovirales phage]